jgi:hypothetical protein
MSRTRMTQTPRSHILVGALLVAAALGVIGCGSSSTPTSTADTITVEVQADPSSAAANRLVVQVEGVSTTVNTALPPGGIVSVIVARPKALMDTQTITVQVTAISSSDCIVGEFNGPVSVMASKVVIKLAAVNPPRCNVTLPGVDGGNTMTTVGPPVDAAPDQPVATDEAGVPIDAQGPAPDRPADVPQAPAAVCGNGVKDPGEMCDPTAPNAADQCPQVCPTTNCMKRKLVGTGCQARCEDDQPETTCRNGDGCCPAGCNASNDDTCKPQCGNGVVEANEACDPLASCPQACPNNRCEIRELVNGGTCQAACQVKDTITVCVSGDNCCPMGCNNANDTDCPANCDNGKIEAGETCDPRTTCPKTCPPVACMKRKMVGQDCSVQCVDDGAITACANNDGCCPSGCNNANDNDCPAVCGNLTLEGDEVCDPGSGHECPQGCPPIACMTRQLKGKDQCHSVCVSDGTITDCKAVSDGCCPSGCHRNPDLMGYDADCLPRCGNGVTEAPELCDANCQTIQDSCKNDKNNIRVYSGFVTSCTSACAATMRTCDRTARDQTVGDGYCPDACTWETDPDCKRDQGQPCSLASGECGAGLSCTDNVCCNQATCGQCGMCAPVTGLCNPITGDDTRAGTTCSSTTSTCDNGVCKLKVGQSGCFIPTGGGPPLGCITNVCIADRCCSDNCAAGHGTLCAATGCSGTSCDFPSNNPCDQNPTCSADKRSVMQPRCDGHGGCVNSLPEPCKAFTCDDSSAKAVCRTQCNGSSDCQAEYTCDLGSHQCLLKAGQPCTDKDQCSSGACLGSPSAKFCCVDGGCPSSDGSGTCSAIACKQGNPTDTTAGKCIYPTATTMCGSAICNAGVQVTANACDGSGGCNPTAMHSCLPYACLNSTDCQTECSSNTDCFADFSCDKAAGALTGTCKANAGGSCRLMGNAGCVTNNCLGNVCCSAGLSCSTDPVCGATKCTTDGTCANAPDTKGCGTLCTTDGALSNRQCDGSGACQEASTTPCANNLRCQVSHGVGACPTSCNDPSDCMAGFTCTNKGKCVAM